MPSKNKDIVNNNKITINLSDVAKEKKEKKRRKKLRRRLLKKQEKELKQAKPAFSNFQYPAPVVVNAINPQQQKQLNLDYDKKLAQVLQTKFDEEYQKRENEKAIKPVEKSAEPKQENVGAFNAVVDGRGFSQTVDMLSKSNNNYRTAQLNTESDNLYNKPFLSAFPLPQDNIYTAETVTEVKAQKAKDFNCPYCNKVYVSQNNLDKHILEKHSNQQTQVKDENPPDNQPDNKPDNKPSDNKQSTSYNKNDFVVDFSEDYNVGTSPVKTIRYIKNSNQRSNTDASLFSSPKPTNNENNQRYNNASLDVTNNDQNDNNDIVSALNNYNTTINNIDDNQPDQQANQSEQIEQPEQSIEQQPQSEQIEQPTRKSKLVSENTLPPIEKQQKIEERKQLKTTINQLIVDREDELHKAFKNKIQADAMIGSRTSTATLQKYIKFLQTAKKESGVLSKKDFDNFK